MQYYNDKGFYSVYNTQAADFRRKRRAKPGSALTMGGESDLRIERMDAAESDRPFVRSIIRLSDLKNNPHPDPFHVWCPLCIAATKQLKKQLNRFLSPTTLAEWLLKNPLKGEVSPSSWSKRAILQLRSSQYGLQRRPTGDDKPYKAYDCLRLPELHITSGIPSLNFLRSLGEGKLVKLFRKDEIKTPWIVVDVYLDVDGSNHRAAYLQSPHRAFQDLFHKTVESTGARPVYARSLRRAHVDDAQILARGSHLSGLLQTLLKFPVMWLAPTLGHFSDLRKTRFQEECANYLSYIINQCRAITLNLDPQLVVAINDASIKELESRSPFLSATDLAFVRDQFACNTFLPQLQHEPLREKVRDAVIQSRGPFLTFQTLARDLKVLLRIQARLQPFLDPSTRGGDNSVRQTLEDNFARRYYMLEQQRGPMPVAPFHDPSEYSRYCYEVLFLYLMRTAASKVVITEQDLQSLAVRAFEGTADSDGDEIRIARPSNLFSSFSDSYDAEVENRQGAKLFGDPAAKLLLYHDQLHASHAPDVCASPAFVARDIVYIFLHGAPPPLHLLQPPVQSLSIPARVTPHENDPEPASYGDSTGSVVTSAYTSRVSTDDWSVLQGTTKTVVRDHAEVVERNLKANESLDGAMNYATTTSSDARTQTESLTPRPSALSHSCFPSNASSRHRLAQSSRRTATFEQSSLYSANEELEDNSSTPRSFSSSMSLFRAINEVKTQVPGLAATSASTGIYHTLLPVKRQPGTSGGCETAETAHNSNGEVPGGSDCQTPTPGVKYSAEADQHAHTLKAVPTIVKFVAVEKPNLHTLVMFNKYAIKAFIESQKELDPRSSFFYWRPDDQVRKRSDVFFDSDPLANAIDRDKADTVYVNSDKLGVTDRSQLSRTAGES